MSKRKDLNLNEFEKILKAQKEMIEKNIETISFELEIIANEDEIDDIEDMAELQIDNTTDQTILRHLKDELAEVESALVRIHNETYGICENTGKEIPLERLKAYPLARTFAE